MDKNLSPYAFTKSKNLELLENLKKWFKFKFEVIYFYNVYGPNHIKSGDMATVIGIFENCYQKNISIPVVKPGTQTRRFTHIDDTIKVCFEAWKKNKCCTTVYLTRKVTLFFKLQNYLTRKLNFYLKEKVKDMRQH